MKLSSAREELHEAMSLATPLAKVVLFVKVGDTTRGNPLPGVALVLSMNRLIALCADRRRCTILSSSFMTTCIVA